MSVDELDALERGFEDIPDPLRRAPAPPAEPTPPAEASPTRQGRRLRVGLGLVVVGAWIVAMCLKYPPRRDFLRPAVVVPMGVWIALAIASAALLFRPDVRGLPRNVGLVRGIVAALPIVFLALALLPSIDAPPQVFSWPAARMCMFHASGVAAVPLLIAAALFRRSLLCAAGWRGAAIGGLFGLSGAMVIHSACPALDATHVLVAHGVTILGGAALGAALGALGGRI